MQSLENLSESQKRLPVREKVAYAMKHAGVSITVTSATDLAAFLIGSTSVIKLCPGLMVEFLDFLTSHCRAYRSSGTFASSPPSASSWSTSSS